MQQTVYRIIQNSRQPLIMLYSLDEQARLMNKIMEQTLAISGANVVAPNILTN